MLKKKSYFIKTFGCQQNYADSERIASKLESQGMQPAKTAAKADYIVINTCMIRQSAENRVYGLVRNLRQEKQKGRKIKIIVTGCLAGMALKEKKGKFLNEIKERLPGVDKFLAIEEVGFEYPPVRTDSIQAVVPISSGCNNFCTYCVVPFARGREKSRPFKEILEEINQLAQDGYQKVTLSGMNVNSYGADLVNQKQTQGYRLPNGKIVKPVMVKHLGRLRIPTLFPFLLEEVCQIEGIKEIDFISSNPWDFSKELIQVIARNPKINRLIHLPVQSGNNEILKRMNRWYSKEEYLSLIARIREKVRKVEFSTDIIVGFCGETEEQFEDTVDLAKKVGFKKAYVARYSERPMTAAGKVFKDSVSHKDKKRRWKILEELINKPNLGKNE